MKNKTKEEISICDNCGEPLSQSEILYGSGWCESCNLPERSCIK